MPQHVIKPWQMPRKGSRPIRIISKPSVRAARPPGPSCRTYLTIKLAHPPDAEVNKYIKQVEELDGRVSDLEAIVKELEEWTGELGKTLLATAPYVWNPGLSDG